MKVLIVDDDADILAFLQHHIPDCGFIVDTAHDGASARNLFAENTYDLIILDFNLPDTTGEALIAHIHERIPAPPILMLSVVPNTQTKVRLLNAGADDYLEKPFELAELVARMHALTRRPRHALPKELAIGDIMLDTKRQVVYRSEQEVLLTKKEFLVLEYLMRHQGAVVPRGVLIEHAWDSRTDPFSRTLETHIANIRKKLGEPETIRTVHGRGFVFE